MKIKKDQDLMLMHVKELQLELIYEKRRQGDKSFLQQVPK